MNLLCLQRKYIFSRSPIFPDKIPNIFGCDRACSLQLYRNTAEPNLLSVNDRVVVRHITSPTLLGELVHKPPP